MLTQSSEQVLIANASNGDLDSFNQLVLHYQHSLYRYAYALVNDPYAADDITQDSFIRAFQNIHRFRGGSFRAWLLAILTNTARDQWRRMGKHPAVSLFARDDQGEEIESPNWIVDRAVSVETIVQEQEDARQLYQMLDELPAAYRSVITLIDLYELDYTEAAQVLKIPLGTLKSRIARARIQMKDKIQALQRKDAGFPPTPEPQLHTQPSMCASRV